MSNDLISAILIAWKELAFWLVVFFVVFGVLARISPCNPSAPLIRKDALTDLFYCFFLPILNRFVRIIFVGAGLFIFFYNEPTENLQDYMLHGFGTLSELPLWIQAAVIFLISDVMLYWTHRLFHGSKLWNFHAIHHSSKHLDWLSTFRFHPVNTWLSFTLVDSVLLICGFSPAAVTLFAVFNLMYSTMVHANLNWTFGPFKYIFASPVFHRWHHTAQEEGQDKNFAPTFPLLDIVFGTFYMPEGKLPQIYGVSGAEIPSGFIKQMIWPFKNHSR